MKYYLEKKFLFVEMNHLYTHCVVQGEDRVICCQKSLEEAESVCREIKEERFKRIEKMKRVLDNGHEYSSVRTTRFRTDIKDLYPTAGLLLAAIKRQEESARSIRVMPLTVEP